jgi:hypothetical protein
MTKNFHEKLKSDHQFTRSYNGVRLTLQSRGLVTGQAQGDALAHLQPNY